MRLEYPFNFYEHFCKNENSLTEAVMRVSANHAIDAIQDDLLKKFAKYTFVKNLEGNYSEIEVVDNIDRMKTLFSEASYQMLLSKGLPYVINYVDSAYTAWKETFSVEAIESTFGPVIANLFRERLAAEKLSLDNSDKYPYNFFRASIGYVPDLPEQILTDTADYAIRLLQSPPSRAWADHYFKLNSTEDEIKAAVGEDMFDECKDLVIELLETPSVKQLLRNGLEEELQNSSSVFTAIGDVRMRFMTIDMLIEEFGIVWANMFLNKLKSRRTEIEYYDVCSISLLPLAHSITAQLLRNGIVTLKDLRMSYKDDLLKFLAESDYLELVSVLDELEIESNANKPDPFLVPEQNLNEEQSKQLIEQLIDEALSQLMGSKRLSNAAISYVTKILVDNHVRATNYTAYGRELRSTDITEDI